MQPLRLCAKCARQRVPEGGVETRPGRWICAACWAAFTQRKAKS